MGGLDLSGFGGGGFVEVDGGLHGVCRDGGFAEVELEGFTGLDDCAGAVLVDGAFPEAVGEEAGDGEAEAEEGVEEGLADAEGEVGGAGLTAGVSEGGEGEDHAPDGACEADQGAEVSDDTEDVDLAEPAGGLFAGGEFGGFACGGAAAGCAGGHAGAEDAGEERVIGAEGVGEVVPAAGTDEVFDALHVLGRGDDVLAEFEETDEDCRDADEGAGEEEDCEEVEGLEEEVPEACAAGAGGGGLSER